MYNVDPQITVKGRVLTINSDSLVLCLWERNQQLPRLGDSLRLQVHLPVDHECGSAKDMALRARVSSVTEIEEGEFRFLLTFRRVQFRDRTDEPTGVKRRASRNRRSGTAVVEVALLMPWLIFLFVGVLDLGFYAYAGICAQNAARAGAVAATASIYPAQYTLAAANNQTNANTLEEALSVACPAVLAEMKALLNVGTTAYCSQPTQAPQSPANQQSVAVMNTQQANILNVTANVLTPPDADPCTSTPPCADCNVNQGMEPPAPQSFQTATGCPNNCWPISVQVMVAYQTVPLIPIPGILPGGLTMTRTVEMRVLQQ